MEFLLGFLIAAAVGLTGVGAGTITAPMLILFFHLPAAESVGTALSFAAVIKLVVLPLYLRRKQVGFRILALLCAGGIPGVLGGVYLLNILNAANVRPVQKVDGTPEVILVVGVNGTGKTTTIGKLAQVFRSQGKTVLLCAADTFRAAAIEQLEIWGQRTGTEVIRTKAGGDPAAVLYDALQAACARHSDYVIVDTAGRLHTKTNLMAELDKMRRTAQRIIPGAPHETLLVMDATTGQNGLEQARQFTDAAGVTGIVLSKLDGTAKGGVVVAISRELGLPVRYVGVGEKAGDLLPFHAKDFVDSLFT